jgi:hypothetical protein
MTWFLSATVMHNSPKRVLLDTQETISEVPTHVADIDFPCIRDKFTDAIAFYSEVKLRLSTESAMEY